MAALQQADNFVYFPISQVVKVQCVSMNGME